MHACMCAYVCVMYVYAGIELSFPEPFSNALKIEWELVLWTHRSSLPVDWGITGEGCEDLVSIIAEPVLFPREHLLKIYLICDSLCFENSPVSFCRETASTSFFLNILIIRT